MKLFWAVLIIWFVTLASWKASNKQTTFISCYNGIQQTSVVHEGKIFPIMMLKDSETLKNKSCPL